MELFVGEEEDFSGDAGLNSEPVKVDEAGGDLLPGLGVPGNRGLHILEPVQGCCLDDNVFSVVCLAGS